MNTSFVECQLQTTYPSQIQDGYLEFISVLWRLIKPVCHWELLLDMHLKHDTVLYSGMANRKGIVDIGIASFAKSDLVSCGVPLGWGEICSIDVRSVKSVCHWVDVRSVHWCEKARALVDGIASIKLIVRHQMLILQNKSSRISTWAVSSQRPCFFFPEKIMTYYLFQSFYWDYNQPIIRILMKQWVWNVTRVFFTHLEWSTWSYRIGHEPQPESYWVLILRWRVMPDEGNPINLHYPLLQWAQWTPSFLVQIRNLWSVSVPNNGSKAKDQKHPLLQCLGRTECMTYQICEGMENLWCWIIR